MSQLKEYKEKMQAVRTLVLGTLQWTDEEFNNFYLDQARDYIANYFAGDEIVVDMFYQCDIFWKWWKNQWHLRDQIFVEYLPELPASICADTYHYLHSARYLTHKPQAPVMDAMWEVVNRELQKQAQAENAAVYAAQSIINQKVQA